MADTKIGGGTVAGALEYLDFLAAKGHVPAGAVAALKSGFRKVMKVVGEDDWADIDVTTIDVDDYMKRFGNMTPGTYSLKSLMDYKSRLNKVLGWYKEFLKTPGWTPTFTVRGSLKAERAEPKTDPREQPQVVEDTRPSVTTAPAVPVASPGMLAYPFPLSDGNLATLNLPASMSAQDASRLARFIESLVVRTDA